MKCEPYTETLLYHMEQTATYCKEKGEQYLKSINAGLSLEQFITLDALSIEPGICQMDLAKILLKDRVYISRILTALEEKELIERKIETKGKRLVKKIYLTDDGVKIHLELQEELKEAFNEVFGKFSEDEMESLKKGILKFKAGVSEFTIMPL